MMFSRTHTDPSESEEHWSNSPIALRSEVKVLYGDASSVNGAFLEDPLSGHRFPLNAWQLAITERLDGRFSLSDLRTAIETGGQLSLFKADEFFDWMRNNHLLEPVAPAPKPKSDSRRRRRLRPNKRRHSPPPKVANPSFDNESWLFGPPAQFLFGSTIAITLALLVWSSIERSSLPEVTQTEPSAKLEEPLPGTIVKTSTGGVLTDIFVSDGDSVREGDVIARIEDPADLDRIENLRHEIGVSRVRRDHHYAEGAKMMWRGEVIHLSELTRELGQHQAEMNAIEMVAPITGVIVTAESCSRLGSMVEPGSVILSVVSDQPEDPSILADNLKAGPPHMH